MQKLHWRTTVVLLQGRSILKNWQFDCLLQQWPGLYKPLKDLQSRHLSTWCALYPVHEHGRFIALKSCICQDNNYHAQDISKGTACLFVAMCFVFNPAFLFITTEVFGVQNSRDQTVSPLSVNSFVLRLLQHSIWCCVTGWCSEGMCCLHLEEGPPEPLRMMVSHSLGTMGSA